MHSHINKYVCTWMKLRSVFGKVLTATRREDIWYLMLTCHIILAMFNETHNWLFAVWHLSTALFIKWQVFSFFSHLTRKIRFRWFQRYDPLVPYTPQWALDDVYIGPPCPDFCNGHGDCQYPLCVCDAGYSGDACEISPSLPVSLRNTFWSICGNVYYVSQQDCITLIVICNLF